MNLVDLNIENHINFDIQTRQAKIIKPVSNGLKVKLDENFLIIGKLNEYFYYGQNMDLEKGLVQRQTFVFTNEQINDLFEPNCMVECTFLAQSINELDCSKDEQLQILQEIDSDWAKCKNSLGISGLVPKSFLSWSSYEKSQSLTATNEISTPCVLRCQSLTPNFFESWEKNEHPPMRPPKPSEEILKNMSINNLNNKKNLDNSVLSSKYLF